MARQRDAWTPWVFAHWAFTILFSFIFAVLCCYTFSEFHRISQDPNLNFPEGFKKSDWVSMFDGAAGSAFFAVLLFVLYLALTVYYMLCSTRNLGHPQNRYGRGVVVAASFYTALHVCNIAVHFTSFSSAMRSWVTNYSAQFNRTVLVSTYVFGYISTVMFLLFALLVTVWRNKPAEAYEKSILSAADNQEMSHL